MRGHDFVGSGKSCGRPAGFSRACLVAILILSGGAPSAFGWDSPVPDVVLYCTHPLAHACRALALAYSPKDSVPVHVFTNSPSGVSGLVRHRARADVVLADAATIDGLIASHLVRPETRVAFGADLFILARDAGSSAQLPQATILIPDPTDAASFDGADTLRQANLTARTQGMPDTPDILASIRRDPELVGLLTATDIAGTTLTAIAPVKAPPMAVAGAIVTLRQSRNAEPFLRFAASAEGRAVLAHEGLETGS